MKALVRYVTRVLEVRDLIWQMAIQDLRTRYAGTLAGWLWLIVHPAAMILVYWLIFSVGFKVGEVRGAPFLLYFLAGMVPWLLFNEILHSSVNSVSGKPYLVHQVAFPTEILPVVSFVSALIPHAFLTFVLFGFLIAYDVPTTLWALQLIYPLICMCVLGIGLGWIVSAINVFYRDAGQVVALVLNIWFWMTPVIWHIGMLPTSLHPVLRLNPLYHVTESYRAAVLAGEPIWQDLSSMVNFWAVALLVFVLGAHVFRRLKPEFADVM